MRGRGMQNQYALCCRVAQLRPCDLDLLQLAQHIAAEVLDGVLIVCLEGVQTKLAVEVLPGEVQRSAEREHAVGEPQVEIEAQGATLERRESVHVEWDRVADNLIKESLTQSHFAFPQSRLIGMFRIPPEVSEFSDEGRCRDFAPRRCVVQLDAAIKQPLHLVAKPGLPAPIGTRDTELPHELGERPA